MNLWKSNFGHPTPSTRCRLRSCVCAMAWRFHAIDATLSPWPRRLDGVEAQDNLTHWSIPHRRQTLLSYCREAKGAKALKAERAARVKAAADAAEQKLRDEEEQERELEKLANALGSKPLVKDKPKKKKPKPPRPPSKESSKENNGAPKDAAAASKTKKGKK